MDKRCKCCEATVDENAIYNCMDCGKEICGECADWDGDFPYCFFCAKELIDVEEQPQYENSCYLCGNGISLARLEFCVLCGEPNCGECGDYNEYGEFICDCCT